MIALSCSGLSPNCTSIWASGSCARKRSMPSCATLSVMSIFAVAMSLAASATPPLASTMPIPSSLMLYAKARFTQTLFGRIHCLFQVLLREVAEMPHTENLALQLRLSTLQHDAILFTQLFKYGFDV